MCIHFLVLSHFIYYLMIFDCFTTILIYDRKIFLSTFYSPTFFLIKSKPFYDLISIWLIFYIPVLLLLKAVPN